MESSKKKKMISLRITEKQFRYLDQMAKRIREQTGYKITRASIILKLMEYGFPYLEKEFPKNADSDPESHFKASG